MEKKISLVRLLVFLFVLALYLVDGSGVSASEKVAEQGYSYVDRLAQMEENLYARGHYVTKNTPGDRMARFKQPTARAIEHGLQGQQMLQQRALRLNSDTNDEIGSAAGRQTDSNFSVILNYTCAAQPSCDSAYRYRTMNGSCNNLQITDLGASNTVYSRLMPANYSDNVQAFRLSSNGSELPSARVVSNLLVIDRVINSAIGTLWVMEWGQFINHDYQNTPIWTYLNGSAISCCYDSNFTDMKKPWHPACVPIPIPANDLHFNKSASTPNATCFNFVRSIAGVPLDCSSSTAEQINSNTHWLDASTVYGSDEITAASLRAFDRGMLLMTNDTANKRTLLPVSAGCANFNACFYGGDLRVLEHPQLTAIHTLMAREHNRVARILSTLNPQWDDETVYQEARRIVVAETQHITYNEFLPVLLGSPAMAKYGLSPLTTGFFTGYNSAYVKAGPVSNEFAAAAFRIGHSLVQGDVTLYAENGTVLPSSYQLKDYYFNASMITIDNTFLDAVLRSLAIQMSEVVDESIIDDMWLYLFRNVTANQKFGFDIAAINLQRGRDHGMPNYNAFREFCGFPPLKSFSDMQQSTSVETTFPKFTKGNMLNTINTYSNVDDIEAYIGMLMEQNMPSGMLGPVASCIIAHHFYTMKVSDRFYYENGNQTGSFTPDQLTEIRKTSLASIICNNNDGGILKIQTNVFLPAGTTNGKHLCSDIPKMTFSAWQQ